MEVLERDVSVLFPGAEDAIRRAARKVPLAIASGALGAEIRRVLDRAGLTACFQAIVSAEDTPASKPAPSPHPSASTSELADQSDSDVETCENSFMHLRIDLRTLSLAPKFRKGLAFESSDHKSM